MSYDKNKTKNAFNITIIVRKKATMGKLKYRDDASTTIRVLEGAFL